MNSIEVNQIMFRFLSDAEQLEIRNRVFTACKTGDVDVFESALDSLRKSLKQVSTVNNENKPISTQISDSEPKANIDTSQVRSVSQTDQELPQATSWTTTASAVTTTTTTTTTTTDANHEEDPSVSTNDP